uniref:hypothetical protein n=1 Tax=Nocardioides stalactiti TaxID=2755356 RepID=UPI0016029354
PADAVVLGTVAADRSRVLLDTQAAAVVGDLLAVPVGDELVATVLPTTGPASSAVLSAGGLIPAEHTPAEAGDLCGGLTSDTLASLGVTRPDLGVPADCTLHQVRPEEVWLVIDAWAELPSWEDQRTATDNAELAFDAVVRGDGVHEVSGLEPVDGLGDEAAVSADGDGLVVRAANVVVVVVRPAPLPGLDADGQREALLRVGEDLLAELERRG